MTSTPFTSSRHSRLPDATQYQDLIERHLPGPSRTGKTYASPVHVAPTERFTRTQILLLALALLVGGVFWWACGYSGLFL